MSYIVCQFVLCLIVADFITGVVHWWEDCYGLPTWPVLGRLVVEPNIDHHLNPGLIGSMGGVLFRNWQSMALFAAIWSVAWAVGRGTWQLAVTGALASMGNEVHMWSHRRDKGGPVARFLQDAAIVQTPQQHSRHHKPPFDAYYCTLTNFTNAALERVNFWRCAEWAIALTGIKPKRMTAARRYV